MLEEAFREARKKWKGNGSGSSEVKTAKLREHLPELLQKLKVETLLDYGCGDPSWILNTASMVGNYIGVDVVPELIEANRRTHPELNFVLGTSFEDDDLPQADLVIVRDVFAHLPNIAVQSAVAQIKRSGARWMLATTKPSQRANTNVTAGGFRPLNLTASPFFFPLGVDFIDEGHEGKVLALWLCDDLPGER